MPKKNTNPAPPVIKRTNLKLNLPAVDCLNRLKQNFGVSKTFAIERGVILLESQLAKQGRLL